MGPTRLDVVVTGVAVLFAPIAVVLAALVVLIVVMAVDVDGPFSEIDRER